MIGVASILACYRSGQISEAEMLDICREWPEVKAITGQTYRIVEQYAAGISQRRMGKAAIHKLETKRNKLPKALDG